MKALGQVPRLLVEVPEQIGRSGLSWAMKGFEKAYSKVTKNKSDDEVMSDMDDYSPSDDAPIEERRRKEVSLVFGSNTNSKYESKDTDNAWRHCSPPLR